MMLSYNAIAILPNELDKTECEALAGKTYKDVEVFMDAVHSTVKYSKPEIFYVYPVDQFTKLLNSNNIDLSDSWIIHINVG